MSKEAAYKILVDNTFTFQMNCNDFFAYACASMINVCDADTEWMLPVIEKWGQHGANACMAYIANRAPIKPHITEEFIQAIDHLKAYSPLVYTDIDYESQFLKEGTYRTFNTFE